MRNFLQARFFGPKFVIFNKGKLSVFTLRASNIYQNSLPIIKIIELCPKTVIGPVKVA